jgi:hypothetical protein
MLWRIRLSLCAFVMLTLLGCQQKERMAEMPSGISRAPTATEVFDLRSKCAALGERILENNPIGSALAQEQISHYNPQTNRCYIRLDVHSADFATPEDKFIREEFLYDGQTKELLAVASVRNGKQFGALYGGLETLAHDPVIPTHQEVVDIMDKFMAENRKP